MFERLKTFWRNLWGASSSYEAVQHIKRNDKGRDFIVGDIHGAFHLLDKSLIEAQFDPKKDRVFSVGDLINRGPASIRCLEFLDKPWFHAVRGNHEQYFIEHYERAGMKLDAKSITEENKWLLDEKPETIKTLYQKLKKLPLAMDIKTPDGLTGIVHADIPKHKSWKKFTRNLNHQKKDAVKSAVYERTRIKDGILKEVKAVTRIYLGHTIQHHGPTVLGNCFYIDTGATYRTENKKELCLTFAEISAPKSAFTAPVNKDRDVNFIHRRNVM